MLVEIKRASKGQSNEPPCENVERVNYVTARGNSKHAWVREMTDAEFMTFIQEESPVILYFGGLDYPGADVEVIIYDGYWE